MIKAAILLRRAAGITHEECISHWRNVHGPIGRQSQIAQRYVRKYVQAEVVACLTPGAPEFDGIAELWFDSRADFEAFFGDPEYAAVIGPDEGNFADLQGLQSFITEETAII